MTYETSYAPGDTRYKKPDQVKASEHVFTIITI